MTSHQVHEVAIKLRYRDLNLAAHIDNVEAVRLTDEARLEFLRFAHLETAAGPRTGLLATLPDGVSELVAGLTVDFRTEMMFDAYEPYVCRMWVSRIGNSSFDLSTEMRTAPDREPALVSVASLVLRDNVAGRVWTMDEPTRALFSEFLGEPVALRARS
ncbi:MAG: acyl-CoA thioesterase [Nocardioides sp.]|uniref:acyl-CoA thioesterase n=1 Tax=Nocardioides sp. TaxID=35761 RepID=UPI003F01AE68